jgi:hypothetical protein
MIVTPIYDELREILPLPWGEDAASQIQRETLEVTLRELRALGVIYREFAPTRRPDGLHPPPSSAITVPNGFPAPAWATVSARRVPIATSTVSTSSLIGPPEPVPYRSHRAE